MVGLRAARSPQGPRGSKVELGTHADRLVHPGHARAAGTQAQPRGRSPHPDPPPLVRLDRPAADSRGNRGVRPTTPIPNAYEALVDRLLASPHYGERWGRHWLDVVHYGDTHGYDKDKRRDNAWPYRDYVIAAFNADLPFGRFIREQVAGDVLWPGDATRRDRDRRSSPPARGTSSATSSCAKGPSTS